MDGKCQKVTRALVDALRERCCSKEELISILESLLPNRSKEALRKRVERFLSKFEELGLVEKRGDKYCWYFYPHLGAGEDLHAKVEHSKKLIPALLMIAEIGSPEFSHISSRGEELNIAAAEEHLYHYPKIWQLLEDYRKLKERADECDRRFNEKVLNSLREEFGDKVHKYSPELQRFVSESVVFEIYHYINNRIHPISDAEGKINWEYKVDLAELGRSFESKEATLHIKGEEVKVKELWFRGTLVARGEELHEKVKEFVKREVMKQSNIEEVKRSRALRYEAYNKKLFKLQDEIRILRHKIECGEPLRGRCSLCPEIEVKK